MKPSPSGRAAAVDHWKHVRSSTLISLICSLAAFTPHQLEAATPQCSIPVIINPDQTIIYQPTPKGDRISDFSTVGYNYGNSALDAEFDDRTYVVVPAAGGPASARAFLRFVVNH